MILLYIFILWVAVCVDSISGDPHVTVTAAVGSTALLPCNLTKEFTETPVVKWQVNKDIVFERSSDGQRYEGPGYEGRVDVPEDELRKGNCSLVLKNVRHDDANTYKMLVMEHVDRTNTYKWKEMNKVELLVVFQIISVPVGSTVLLPCEWRNPSIQTAHVEWNTDRGVVFERSDTESLQGEGYEGRVDVPEVELLTGNCSLVLKNVTVTDAAVYRSCMIVENTKETVLLQKVQLSVYEKPKERKDGKSASDEAGINGPVLLILIISLLVCFLSSH